MSAATSHEGLSDSTGQHRTPPPVVLQPRGFVSGRNRLHRQQTTSYSEKDPRMSPRALLAAALTLALAAPVAHADVRSDAKAQVEFGIAVAQRGLWQEARYRWQRAIEIDPSYAAAWNNLGIAYEHEGQFDKAREAYEKATELEPGNLMIQQNYDLFREINDRANR